MTRIIRTLGLALALAAAGLGGSVVAWTAGSTAAASTSNTPLPPGWELCVLQGLTAPLTPANVTDLDAWQAAEGGSTNNTAAFNPFNTQRTTDLTGPFLIRFADGVDDHHGLVQVLRPQLDAQKVRPSHNRDLDVLAEVCDRVERA